MRNSPVGVEIELQGEVEQLALFRQRLQTELPPLAQIQQLDSRELPEQSAADSFDILPSSDGRAEAQVAPDTALCGDCLREFSEPADRRFHHPFISCTNCGPRWTIVTGIPYDRPLTTMAGFPLCPSCEQEYRNPLDRRFHAQPIACPVCGPQLALVPPDPDPLARAVTLLQQGKVVAVKGLGGYHLAVDAGNQDAVQLLRQRKQRDEKPFAVMVPDLAAAQLLADFSELEGRLLGAPEAPVVIVRAKPGTPLAPAVAPGSRWVGLLLAYTPLHQLLFACGAPAALVMTSANPSDEPMLADDDEARVQLAGIADAILTHNRPIKVRTDDSVLRVFQGQPLFYRRSRGYVPQGVSLPFDSGRILAVGAELKNTICLTRGSQAFLSQHIGDLKNEATLETFRQTIAHLGTVMEIRPEAVACDLHPDYLSSRYAEASGLPLVTVQHHHAHLAACMAENSLEGDLLGVIFDGTGLGDDGTVWGGEFLAGGYGKVQRLGHLKQVRLLGGDAAAREPWRMVAAWLYPAIGDAVWQLPDMPTLAATEQQLLQAMLARGINAPFTSSAGRLFDAAALLSGAATGNRFDGQAGMALEALAESTAEPAALQPATIEVPAGGPFALDCTPLLLSLAEQRASGSGKAALAYGFHSRLSEAVLAGCNYCRQVSGLSRVVLSGGVFQNRLLTDLVYTRLAQAGFEVFLHRLVPPNDGGLALGQAAVAAQRRR